MRKVFCRARTIGKDPAIDTLRKNDARENAVRHLPKKGMKSPSSGGVAKKQGKMIGQKEGRPTL